MPYACEYCFFCCNDGIVRKLSLRYGLCGYDTGIQCGVWYVFYRSDCLVTYGYFLLHTLFLDWVIINTLVLIIILVSKKTSSPFASMGISFAIMYLGNIEVINNILSGAVPTVKRIFSFLLPALKNILYKSYNHYNKEKFFDIVNSDKFLRTDSIRNIQKSQRNIVEFL